MQPLPTLPPHPLFPFLEELTGLLPVSTEHLLHFLLSVFVVICAQKVLLWPLTWMLSSWNDPPPREAFLGPLIWIKPSSQSQPLRPPFHRALFRIYNQIMIMGFFTYLLSVSVHQNASSLKAERAPVLLTTVSLAPERRSGQPASQ